MTNEILEDGIALRDQIAVLNNKIIQIQTAKESAGDLDGEFQATLSYIRLTDIDCHTEYIAFLDSLLVKYNAAKDAIQTEFDNLACPD